VQDDRLQAKFSCELYNSLGRGESRLEISDGATMNRTDFSATHSRRLVIATGLCLLGFGLHAASPIDQQKLASANSGFAFKLLKQLAKDQPGTNIFISPYSASTVLQMACNGAAGQTKTEMQQVLGTTGLAAEALNTANKDCDQAINSQGTNIVLTAANAIWYRKGIPVKPAFIACNQQFFGATVDTLDFDDARSVGIMNAWASEKTHGRINGIADGLIDPLTELVLANAVYFKGKWEEPFEVKSTKEKVFHLRAGRQKQVPMMEQTRKFTYRRGTGYQAVRLPYQGWALAMYVFLPDADSSPDKLIGIMTGDTWQRVTEPGFNKREGTVVLPRFKLEYGVELKAPLKALGMRAAFGRANFSGISDRPLFVSAVRQRAFVEVNEEGTEAAAVTGMTHSQGIEVNPPKPFQMIVDRPFLFLIEDQQTRTILFMGVVYDPGASS
jgi:serine protease inhibitor